jgi:hypothetical protein
LLHHRRGARGTLAGRRGFEARGNDWARGIHYAATLADGAAGFMGARKIATTRFASGESCSFCAARGNNSARREPGNDQGTMQ